MFKRLGLAASILLLSTCRSPKSDLQYVPGRKPAEFADPVLQDIRAFYTGRTNERIICLTGSETENAYLVSGFYAAELTVSEETKAVGHCSKNDAYIGSAHNHPSGVCAFSDLDSYAFYVGKTEHVQGVVCQADSSRFQMVVRTKPYDWYNTGRKRQDIWQGTVEREEAKGSH